MQRDQRNQSKAQSSRLVKYSADKSAYIGPSWLGPVGEYVEAPHSVQDLTSSRADEGQLPSMDLESAQHLPWDQMFVGGCASSDPASSTAANDICIVARDLKRASYPSMGPGSWAETKHIKRFRSAVCDVPDEPAVVS